MVLGLEDPRQVTEIRRQVLGKKTLNELCAEPSSLAVSHLTSWQMLDFRFLGSRHFILATCFNVGGRSVVLTVYLKNQMRPPIHRKACLSLQEDSSFQASPNHRGGSNEAFLTPSLVNQRPRCNVMDTDTKGAPLAHPSFCLHLKWGCPYSLDGPRCGGITPVSPWKVWFWAPASSVCPGEAQGSSLSSTIMTASSSSGPRPLQDPFLQQCSLPSILKKGDQETSRPLRSPKSATLETGASSHCLWERGVIFLLAWLCLVFLVKWKLAAKETNIFGVTT